MSMTADMDMDPGSAADGLSHRCSRGRAESEGPDGGEVMATSEAAREEGGSGVGSHGIESSETFGSALS
jgi:hypothetical protein